MGVFLDVSRRRLRRLQRGDQLREQPSDEFPRLAVPSRNANAFLHRETPGNDHEERRHRFRGECALIYWGMLQRLRDDLGLEAPDPLGVAGDFGPDLLSVIGEREEFQSQCGPGGVGRESDQIFERPIRVHDHHQSAECPFSGSAICRKKKVVRSLKIIVD